MSVIPWYLSSIFLEFISSLLPLAFLSPSSSLPLSFLSYLYIFLCWPSCLWFISWVFPQIRVSFFHLLDHYSYKLERVTCFWSLLRTTPLYITYSCGYKVPEECFAQNINFISLFTLIYIQCIFVCNYDLDKFVCSFIWEIYKPRERELFFNLCTPGLP